LKTKVETAKAPAAIGPYSQGISTGNLVFVSGQLPIDPATNIMPDNVTEQTLQSLQNLKNILEAAGSSIDKVCKTTVFLQNMSDFTAMNQVYETVFGEGVYPARSAVAVAQLPKDALVEIEAIAYKQ